MASESIEAHPEGEPTSPESFLRPEWKVCMLREVDEMRAPVQRNVALEFTKADERIFIVTLLGDSVPDVPRIRSAFSLLHVTSELMSISSSADEQWKFVGLSDPSTVPLLEVLLEHSDSGKLYRFGYSTPHLEQLKESTSSAAARIPSVYDAHVEITAVMGRDFDLHNSPFPSEVLGKLSVGVEQIAVTINFQTMVIQVLEDNDMKLQNNELPEGAIELRLGALKLSLNELLALQPGAEIELQGAETLSVSLYVAGSPWVRGTMEMNEKGIQFKVLEEYRQKS